MAKFQGQSQKAPQEYAEADVGVAAEERSSSSTVVEVVEVSLIDQAVLDAVEAAASYHPPPTYIKTTDEHFDIPPAPLEGPFFNLCGRPRCTAPLERKTPIAWIIPANEAPFQYWVFGLLDEQLNPPARNRHLPSLPILPLASPIMEVRTMQDDSKPVPDNKWIHKDKSLYSIVLAILQLHMKPSVDGFGERGMTVIDLDDIFEILGDEGGDHMVFSPSKHRSVLRDDSLLMEKGRELGLPRLVMAWLGGAQLGGRLILPTSTMKVAYERAVELFLARKRVQQATFFASAEDREMIAAAGADDEPAVCLTLWKNTRTFPGWLWRILIDTNARLSFHEPEKDGTWVFGGTTGVQMDCA